MPVSSHETGIRFQQAFRVSQRFADRWRISCGPLPTTYYDERMTQSSISPQETLPDQMPFSAKECAQTPLPVQRFVLSLLARVQTLEARVTALREQVNCNSPNSSLPPSSDGPQVPPRPSRQNKSMRKRGGQKGHPGTTRKLVPLEQVKGVLYITTETCRHCGDDLAAEDPEPWRHQVTEIPPVVAEVPE